MPHLGPIKRRDLIVYLKRLGFGRTISWQQPSVHGKKKDNATLIIPNPHHGDIGEGFLLRILKQAGIDRATWEKL